MTRAQIKEDAKLQLKQNKVPLMIVNVIVAIFMNLPSIVEEYLSKFIYIPYEISIIAIIITLILGRPLMIGLIKMNLSCIKNKKVEVKDLLKGFENLYLVYTTSILQTIIIYGLTIPLVLIPITLAKDISSSWYFVAVITNISSIFFTILFSQLEYIIADKKDINPIEAIKKSLDIISKNMLNYLFFTISFVGWLILVGLTFGIAYIWVGPYMQLSYANLYVHLKRDILEEYKESKINKKNRLIYGLIAAIILAGETKYITDITTQLFAPTIIKNITNQNNLKIISVLTVDEEYNLTPEESASYKINYEKYEGVNLTKFVCLVKGSCLDIKKGDNIDYTVINILAEDDKIIGITAMPYDKQVRSNVEKGIYNPGKYDIEGNLIKNK